MALFLQIAVPLTTIVVPLIYIFSSIIVNYYNQTFTNFAMLMGSTHGFMSSIIMIMVHRPYREAFMAMIGKTRKIVLPAVSMKTTSVDVLI
ncbi:hypothetical protein B9Z55_017234 [Caenorhabditis nigoni]|uniref:G-protein coupled receptors family 1 profile domain-containing protein n=1 Tax=Caenorhabditis nigoni TaxID=1611254 RepID=A0A2G5T922_9PELO|nr:hypothetical protein B9Z55_017234 [Caenorhabditis nigoni]